MTALETLQTIWLTEGEVAQMFGVETKTIADLRREGNFTYSRITPRRVLYHIDDISSYIEKCLIIPFKSSTKE